MNLLLNKVNFFKIPSLCNQEYSYYHYPEFFEYPSYKQNRWRLFTKKEEIFFIYKKNHFNHLTSRLSNEVSKIQNDREIVYNFTAADNIR